MALVGSSVFDCKVTADSRCVDHGDVFVAVVGNEFDGHDFIGQAIHSGASFIVCEESLESAIAEIVVVEDSSVALGVLVQQSLGNPSAKLTNLAVTGTNGKTTVSYMVRSVIRSAGKKCGLIGTIVYDTGGDSEEAPLTTPDAGMVAKLARTMADDGAEYMVIEASSHALSQNRLAGVDFTAAAFTNLTGDHLDYHKTTEEYLAAKTRLFTQLPCHATAILNKQSEASQKIAAETTARVLWYAIDKEADIVAHIDSMDAGGTVYTLFFDGQDCQVRTGLIGEHNVSNHLAAAGLCLAAGFDLETIGKGLEALEAVPGRLEGVDCGQDFSVLVDYAHTDDALRNVLKTLRPLAKKNLTVLFGCGGDRDKTKRPRMAKIAEEFADKVIVTSDNPRTEDPDAIIADVVEGLSDAKAGHVIVEADRRRAIELAINGAECDDIVLLAGKGHETYQILGKEKIDFDDREVAAEFLRQIVRQS